MRVQPLILKAILAAICMVLFAPAPVLGVQTTGSAIAVETTTTAPTVATAPSAEGATDQAAFDAGNAAYRQQDFPAAAGWYQALIEEGLVSPHLFYNRGNTAAQLGSTGEAVLNYSRAFNWIPRDADLRANFARVLPPGEHEAPPDFFGAPGRWVRFFTLGEWWTLFAICYAAAGVCVAAWLWVRRGGARGIAIWRRAAWITVAMALIVAIPAGVRRYQAHSISHVVVLEKRASVFSGPGDEFPQVGYAVEGSRLPRLQFEADPAWTRVVLPDGLRGFMRTADGAVLRGDALK
ncbi:hypothetical protein CVU37_01445 [candidate division BRC1 bacterium HGW-BRC1-1]|jgi:tetratricopeptide (TPR) repeat protein|nr:MAG: hypothetical protein CVU37_01445 [candidate division BRC1 bacterium HGW-BRC1-1]